MRRTPRVRKSTPVKPSAKPIPKGIADLEREISELTKRLAVVSAESSALVGHKPPPNSNQQVLLAWYAKQLELNTEAMALLVRLAECKRMHTDIKKQKISATKTVEMEIAELQLEASGIQAAFDAQYAESRKIQATTPVNSPEELRAWMAKSRVELSKLTQLTKKMAETNRKLIEKQLQQLKQLTDATSNLPI